MDDGRTCHPEYLLLSIFSVATRISLMWRKKNVCVLFRRSTHIMVLS